jgi:hypothetical protein
MPSLRVCCPVIGRQRHSPNVSWLIKFNPAVPRVLGIDIDNPSRSTLIRQVDVNHGHTPPRYLLLNQHRYATRKQVETCYPQFAEFIRLKKKYDP